MLGIAKGLLALGSTVLEGKRKKQEAKDNHIAKKIEQDGDWESIHAKGAQHSWKDEFWTIIFAIPMVLAFIPGMELWVAKGFAALSNTPEWYRWSIAALVGSSVGIRNIKQFFIK